jgi:hypothetical protein
MTNHKRKTMKKGGWLFSSNTSTATSQPESGESWGSWISNLFKSKPTTVEESTQPSSTLPLETQKNEMQASTVGGKHSTTKHKKKGGKMAKTYKKKSACKK